jgi:hypothetical protein
MGDISASFPYEPAKSPASADDGGETIRPARSGGFSMWTLEGNQSNRRLISF